MKLLILALAVSLFTACSDKEDQPVNTDQPKKQCALPWGGLINHGDSVLAYKEKEALACEKESRTCNDGSLTGSHSQKDCLSESETHEKPMKISDKDLKIGGIKEVGKLSTRSGGNYDEMFPPKPKLEEIPNCPTGTTNGTQCSEGAPACKIDRMVYSCNTQTTWKVFGWVYEEIGRDYKPAEGVTADIFWFAGCFVGFCKPMAGPVKTDKYGYFEILTQGLMDSLRLNGLDVGLYAFCKDGKPIAGGGSYISHEMVGKPFSDALANQKRLKPDSCKL